LSDGDVILQRCWLKERILSGRLKTNFAIGAIGGDNLQDSFESTEFFHVLVRGTAVDSGALR
jgi:hypothetical protein